MPSQKKLVLIISIVVFTGVVAVSFGFLDEGGVGEESTEVPNYEAIAVVREVLDGDTLKVNILQELNPHEGVELGKDKIRLAGIDTEEMDVHKAVSEHKDVKNMTQAEYEETIYYQHALAAKNLIKSLAPKETKIYLDIDDLAHGKGPYRGLYGRLITVVYIKDEEKWINLNSEVLNQEYPTDYDQSYKLIINSYNSEFNPYDWLSSNS
ncbi:hypothetical protein AKJ53_01015 [candidate division MSBL1 archaeon SCGC-AAA382F02]|uniref:TNase-like domain-containing protein n=1 Tax=candidate division MSBL1 archaeon SCGC-AAA382F02 TaxID=1698282 RepID=A0A133VIF3_9EURY|nr:hypothetical protein AKJ53_01015 [candidate division MSBL1 archaeon SCGC-AAA382F02]